MVNNEIATIAELSDAELDMVAAGVEHMVVLDSGRVTADLRPKGAPATTDEVAHAIKAAL